MSNFFEAEGRSIVRWLAMGMALLLFSFALLGCSREKEAPQVYPADNAPVTAVIDGKMLLIANNSAEVIYQQIFPTEILAVIEWAPCLAPESCPAEQRIDPGTVKRIAVNSIVRDESESITVFWWTYLEKLPGASIPPMEMNEFGVPLP